MVRRGIDDIATESRGLRGASLICVRVLPRAVPTPFVRPSLPPAGSRSQDRLTRKTQSSTNLL